MAIINKNKIKYFLLAFFVLFIIFISFNSFRIFYPANINLVEVGGEKIMVDVANTPESRTLGLSGRKSLENDEGMLFVFDQPSKYSFWMKDMNFPIDIIWLDESKKIVHIKKDARPELYPESYAPRGDAKYVLEVVSGFSEKNNLKEGDKVKFEY